MKKIWFLGILLWLVFAWLQIGYDSPDEHFPTLEAASFLAKGVGTLTWEWQSGLRSWIPPVILSIPLKLLVWLGINNPLLQDHLLRSFIAIIWLLSLRIAQNSGVLTNRQFFWLIFGAPFVVWGTRFGLDTLCFSPLLLSVMYLEKKDYRKAALFTALSVLIRFTTAVPLLILLLFKLRGRKNVFEYSFFFFITFILGSTFDAILYQHYTENYFIPVWSFFKFNVIEGSGQFHASPWYEFGLYLLALWTPVAGFIGRPWNNFPIFLSIIFSLLFFSIVKHTELRFVFPLLIFTCLLVEARGKNLLWFKISKVLNFIMLALAALLYTEPHGSLVKGFALASLETKPSTHALAIEGYTGASLPMFYLNSPLSVFQVDTDNWKLWCEGKRPAESSITSHHQWTWRVLAETPCEQSISCKRIAELDLSLGFQLRQKISKTRGFRYIYECFLPKS